MTLGEIAQTIGARVRGDAKTEVTRVASVAAAGGEHLIFVQEPERLQAALASPAGAVIAGNFAADHASIKPLLLAAEPRLAFARAARLLHPPRRYPAGIHSSAVMPRSAKMGKHVSIGPNVVLGEDCVLGDRTRIGPGCCIANGVEVGSDCFIDNNVSIYSGTRLGNRVAVH